MFRLLSILAISLSLIACVSNQSTSMGGQYTPNELERPRLGQIDSRIGAIGAVDGRIDNRIDYSRRRRLQAGVYRPAIHQIPQLTLRLPPVDECRSQLYQSLLGQHEGSIHFAGLPGRKRVLKPAFDERAETFFTEGNGEVRYIEVRDYLPGQRLYTPNVVTQSLVELEAEIRNRLTIRLDNGGFVSEVECG